MTGWWWLGLGTIAIIAPTMYFGQFDLVVFQSKSLGVEQLPSVDQRVLEVLAGLRTAALTRAMVVVAGLSAQWVIAALGWATILVLLAARRFRHLLVFLGATLLIHWVTANLADATLEQVAALRPAEIAVLGPTGQSAYPVLPLAMLTGRLVSMLYCLVPQGRRRQQGKAVVAGIIALVALARLYLAIDTPITVLVAIIIGVMIPLVAFRWLCPDEVFPVTYRRGRTAHLDVGGRRGEAIRRALHDQLGVIVEDVQPFALAGSAGSTPLRIKVKGDEDAWLFAKLYAKSHLRADRSYKLGRALLYGRLEDEKPFNTVRRFVQQEDYALALMQRAGVPSPEPYGVVELTPEREYLVVTEFLDGATEISQAQVDDAVIDQGLGIIRRLWEAGLAHRDIKPANLLVRDGRLYLIDVFFTEVRPSPWRQGVDLANMLLVLALRSDPKRVYERALREFTVQEISEAFAATRGLTMPSQLRRLLRAQGRDLHAEFLRLLPSRPRPIAIQRFSARRLGLTLAVLVGTFLAVVLVLTNLTGLGLNPWLAMGRPHLPERPGDARTCSDRRCQASNLTALVQAPIFVAPKVPAGGGGQTRRWLPCSNAPASGASRPADKRSGRWGWRCNAALQTSQPAA
jgi:tRNA A-37 threonylcarbamoyl transferase component Bud32